VELVVHRNITTVNAKAPRKIFGPTRESNGIWRIKTNKELDELITHRNIIHYFNQILMHKESIHKVTNIILAGNKVTLIYRVNTKTLLDFK